MRAHPSTYEGNPTYWRTFGFERGRHYFEQREGWETPEYMSEAVSDHPAIRAAFVEGWKAAEAESHLWRGTS